MIKYDNKSSDKKKEVLLRIIIPTALPVFNKRLYIYLFTYAVFAIF